MTLMTTEGIIGLKVDITGAMIISAIGIVQISDSIWKSDLIKTDSEQEGEGETGFTTIGRTTATDSEMTETMSMISMAMNSSGSRGMDKEPIGSKEIKPHSRCLCSLRMQVPV